MGGAAREQLSRGTVEQVKERNRMGPPADFQDEPILQEFLEVAYTQTRWKCPLVKVVS